VIFDLDGVLLDSSHCHFQAWQRLGAELGVEVGESFFLRTFGKTNDQILPELLGRPLDATEARLLSERKESLFRSEAAGRLELFEGATALLERLRAAGWGLALASSTTASNLFFLGEELGLDRMFDVMVSADDVNRGKPDPEVFLAASERLGLRADRCVVVEDAVAGFEAAAAAGMPCVAVATTNPIDRLSDRGDLALVVSAIADLDVEDFRRILG
jgi:beta-phosphoglucomutase family hydrolase